MPISDLTEALNSLLSARNGHPIDHCLEGDLTLEEAGQVMLDVEHIDTRAVFAERMHITREKLLIRERRTTLREVLDGLNPIHQ